mmetsp:Transcript_22537/g.45263  ORF Transcript_22537/g.45263 Transcript_22537/m.45263 type:complete len:256 (-) Transcript_22537:108-875(-)|eukprot:CAMPEP_0167814906 /NCGR_PEP_ID=MMETSP0112_2-20121227/2707_1 /TAXON_ID=91324 /ORGANISM="Lotharella globosa, Strain CCCM811" /LENGTH=255 /DNA_ID=CAMNT_0007714227 /DNA_START=14 /DNA_END=781 /DNA_ORIENTATION=-
MGCGAIKGEGIAADKRLNPESPQSMMHIGIIESDVDMVKKAMINAPQVKDEEIKESKMTPVEFAVTLGHPTPLRELLRVDSRLETRSGRDILTLAINSGRKSEFKHQKVSDSSVKDVVSLLLDAKCDVNKKDEGLTPLQRAVKHNLAMTCEELLKRKADINVTNERKQTLLHMMADSSLWNSVVYSEVFRLLLDNGLDPFAKDESGQTYLDLLAPPKHQGPDLVRSKMDLKPSMKKLLSSDAQQPQGEAKASATG